MNRKLIGFGVGAVSFFGGLAAAETAVLHDAAHKVNLIYERVAKDGQITITETWSIGKSSRILKRIYTESGTPTEAVFALTKGNATTRVDATITAHGAILSSTARNGSGPTSNIPLMKTATIADPSILWFAKNQPQKAASTSFMSFDPEFRYWEQITVTFDGRGKLGSSPEGNLVTRQTARQAIHMVLDDKGLPIYWEDSRNRLWRDK